MFQCVKKYLNIIRLNAVFEFDLSKRRKEIDGKKF